MRTKQKDDKGEMVKFEMPSLYLAIRTRRIRVCVESLQVKKKLC